MVVEKAAGEVTQDMKGFYVYDESVVNADSCRHEAKKRAKAGRSCAVHFHLYGAKCNDRCEHYSPEVPNA